MRHALNRRRAGADDPDPLAGQARQAAVRGPAGIVVVPTAGVEGMPLEGLDAGNAGQLGPMQRAVGHADEARLHGVAAVGGDDPAPAGLVPGHAGDLGLETGVGIEVVLLADGAAVGQDLRRAGILLDRHVADLFQQRQIDVGFDVASRAWIAVPVPGPAEVAALLDDANVLHPGLAQPRGGQQAAEAAADHHHLDLIGQGRAGEARGDIGIVEVVGEVASDFLVLGIALGPQALVALGAVLFAQLVGIEAEPALRLDRVS